MSRPPCTPRSADLGALLSLGVMAHSRKENEHRLPIHPEHLHTIDEDLRGRIFRHAQILSVDFHERYTSGRLISRSTTDVESLRGRIALG